MACVEHKGGHSILTSAQEGGRDGSMRKYVVDSPLESLSSAELTGNCIIVIEEEQS